MKKETMDIITLLISSGGIVFSAIAAGAAWRSATLSSRQLKEQKKEQERIEKPRLVPLNKLVIPHPISVLSDWKQPKSADGLVEKKDGELVDLRFVELPTRFSNVKIPMLNAGKSFAIDVTYSLELVDGIKSIDEFHSAFSQLKLVSPNLKDYNPKMFSFVVTDYDHEKEFTNSNTEAFVIAPHFRHISLIESNKIEEIFVPSYFVVLCNIYLKEFYANSLSEKPLKMKKPRIKLVIKYNDQYYKRHQDEYLMELSTKQFESASYHPRFEAWIDFTYIEQKKLKNKSNL
ncbi:hypothetical protein [Exiguobacterium sp. MH3]|uniref:hypothetical protein n=1 Tax=Exiguobacterium sp. MH3 TaxID=1399115 RepID=UPI0003C3D575|nr:hypothetical protein [Exiguobacterium sp. MH3]AHA31325.1 hypothetical protein U719_06805 [Exiguobacterium sp. MH3]